ncbi:hypothetical protein [Streptomyces sp. NBC_00289]|uniref:hypothetical protein n=1 Tax=Streptomyces sp. NBC_00289 TaxID=2975703 RepID=UPI00352C8E3B
MVRRSAAGELDAVAYAFEPAPARPAAETALSDPGAALPQEYARSSHELLAEAALPGVDPAKVVFPPHHVGAAQACSAGPASPHPDTPSSTAAARTSRISRAAPMRADSTHSRRGRCSTPPAWPTKGSQ